MRQTYFITHYYHSGFSVACEDTLLVFDYWRGEKGELAEKHQIHPDFLKCFSHVFVFISHEHIDHMDPVVFTWRDIGNVNYIVSSDMPVGTRGKRMAPGDTLTLTDDIIVTAYDSTDLGVSFLVDFKGFSVFHAGDLNYWHWRDESTLREIENAESEFRKAVAPLCKEQIDLAFFPVDPRQGAMFEAGANYFILSVKPRLFIPMHYFHRVDVAIEYARIAGCRSTEVLAMPGYGDTIRLEIDEEGYFNISFPEMESLLETMKATKTAEKSNQQEDPETERTHDSNPFDESDLPLPQLVNEIHPEEAGALQETTDREKDKEQPN